MKGREAKAAPSADLLVCFPSRAHFTLMPKPICSPARPSESNKRYHHLKKSGTRGGGQASPLLWTKAKSMGSEIAEPTSPKVTCAGQIKVRQKTAGSRNWQSVMEEIEKIHNNKKHRKRSNWADSLCFKKEIVQFLTCLRSIRFDLRCFGSFSETDTTTEDGEEADLDEAEGYQENHVGIEESDNDTSRNVFSKWFMVLQENQNNGFQKEDREDKDKVGDDGSIAEPTIPPPNALLLMRCRSAPAKSWLEENEEQEKEDSAHKEQGKEEVELKNEQSPKSLMEEEKNKKENLVVMRYDSDFHNISSDIANETWIVGGLRDQLSRNRSWKT